MWMWMYVDVDVDVDVDANVDVYMNDYWVGESGRNYEKHRKLLKGVCHEIFQVLFWHV